jgi:hypothetical protein
VITRKGNQKKILSPPKFVAHHGRTNLFVKKMAYHLKEWTSFKAILNHESKILVSKSIMIVKEKIIECVSI